MSVVDQEELSEHAYETLLSTLADLSLNDAYGSQDSLVMSGHQFRPRPRHRLIYRTDRTIEQRRGFADGTYAGSPWHHSLRYSLEVGSRWKTGLSLDKDAGESWRYRMPWADSYSMFIQYRPSTRLRAIVGNYRLHFGQGLLMNQQFSLGKNLLATQLYAPILSPHGSPSEGDRMQGAAVEYQLNRKFSILPFVSVRQIDGNLTNDTLTTWSQDGLHRTGLERSHRNTSWLTDLGIHAVYRNEWIELGANVLYSQFQHDYIRPKRVYNGNVFRGHQLLSGSIDYKVHLLGFWLTGEVAMDDGAALAAIGSLRRSIGEDWMAYVQYRFLSDEYRQLHGATAAESSQMQGEKGVSLGVKGCIGRRWTLSALADYWHFSQPQYGIHKPSDGAEGQLIALYQRPKVKLQGNYRIKWKAKNDGAEALTHYIRHSIDGVLTWQATHAFTLRSQLHTRFYSAANVGGVSTGISGSQAVAYSYAPLSLKGALQATWFHTDNYDTRLYLREPTVLYGFDLPMLYGRGQRLTANLQYGWPMGHETAHAPQLTLECKYALLHYSDHRTSISTSSQEIRSRNQQNIWFQLRIMW